MKPLLFSFFLLVQMQLQPPNAVLLVAKPDLLDPNFRETVVLAHQTEDGSTVGVILNRPGEPRDFGGPVMQQIPVVVFRSAQPPEAPAFHVLPDVYLSMHPQNVNNVVETRRLFTGFAGWAPGQLESELARDGWYVLPASAEIVFRQDTKGLWEELVRKARGRVAMR